MGKPWHLYDLQMCCWDSAHTQTFCSLCIFGNVFISLKLPIFKIEELKINFSELLNFVGTSFFPSSKIKYWKMSLHLPLTATVNIKTRRLLTVYCPNSRTVKFFSTQDSAQACWKFFKRICIFYIVVMFVAFSRSIKMLKLPVCLILSGYSQIHSHFSFLNVSNSGLERYSNG